MSTPTAASAAAAPVAPVTQPVAAPAPTVAPSLAAATVAAEQIIPVAPVNATPIKTANDIVHASGDDLSARYGLKALEDTPADVAAGETVVPVAPVDATAPVGDSGAVAVPEAVVAPEVIAQPVTSLTLYDDKGELDIPANVKLAFKVDGRDYKDLTIDQVVRMAQQAPNIVNQKTAELTQRNQQVEQAYTQLATELQRNNALYEQLLTNPQLYQEAASQYQAQNSPEQRLARLQEQQQAERTQHQQELQQTHLQQTVQAAAHFTATRIAPSVDALTTQYPTVDAGDVMAKFHELTAPLLSPSPSGGVWVAPNRLAEVESSVLPALHAWTAQRAQKSAAATQAATTQANAQLKQAQTETALAKRQMVRPLTPVGTRPTADAPKPPPIKTAGDAVEASLARARLQIQQQGAA